MITLQVVLAVVNVMALCLLSIQTAFNFMKVRWEREEEATERDLNSNTTGWQE